MGYAEFLVRTPWSWVALAALTLAAAVRNLFTACLLRGRLRRRRERDMATALFLISTTLVLLTLAVFIPGPSRFLDPALWLFGAGVLAVALAAVSLPLLFGVPLALLLSVVLVLFSGYLQTWTPAYPPDDIAGLRVLSAHQERLTIELMDAGRGDWHEVLIGPMEVRGGAVAIEIELIKLHHAYFLLGCRYAVRLHAVHGYRYDPTGGTFTRLATGPISTLPSETALRVESLVRAGRVPGVRIDTRLTEPRRVSASSEYTLRIPAAERLILDTRH